MSDGLKKKIPRGSPPLPPRNYATVYSHFRFQFQQSDAIIHNRKGGIDHMEIISFSGGVS